MCKTIIKIKQDLDGIDVEMNAVKVFLKDGSHRTVVTTPDTTCGEILRDVLCKIDKEEEQNNYSLHLEYALSGIRVAMDSEQVKDLAPSYYDPLKRIYLCSSYSKSSGMTYHATNKRHPSQSISITATATANNIPASTCNRTHVSTFSTAWKTGSEKKQHSLYEDTDNLHSVRRKRKPRLSMSRGSSQFQFFVDDCDTSPYYENIEAKFVQDNQKSCEQLDKMKAPCEKRRHSSGIFEDVDSWLGERSVLMENISESLPRQHYRSNIEGKHPDRLKKYIRDSGTPIIPRGQEFNDMDSEYVEMKPATIQLSSEPNDSFFIDQEKLHVSKLNSSKSLEDLTSDVIDEITDFSLSNQDNTNQQHTVLSPQHDYDYPSLIASPVHTVVLYCPEIPKRHSSLFTPSESQISNDVLIQQGKRLSLLLNCNKESQQIKSTLGTTVKAAFNKMRKVSLPAMSIPRAKSPTFSKQKRKISVQVSSQPVLTKHPSMEEVVSKPKEIHHSRNLTNLMVPSTGMAGKRSHSFSHLKEAFSDEIAEYEAMLPQWNQPWNQQSNVQNSSYEETSVRLIVPLSLSPKLFSGGNIITDDVKLEPSIPWTPSQRIRKVATASPHLRPPLPNFIRSVSPHDDQFSLACSKSLSPSPSKKPLLPLRPCITLTRNFSSSSNVTSSSLSSDDVKDELTEERKRHRKGSHPVFYELSDKQHEEVKSKSVNDLISFFTE